MVGEAMFEGVVAVQTRDRSRNRPQQPVGNRTLIPMDVAS